MLQNKEAALNSYKMLRIFNSELLFHNEEVFLFVPLFREKLTKFVGFYCLEI